MVLTKKVLDYRFQILYTMRIFKRKKRIEKKGKDKSNGD